MTLQLSFHGSSSRGRWASDLSYLLIEYPIFRPQTAKDMRMTDDICKSEKGRQTAYLRIGAWYDPKQDSIHLTLPRSGWFHTTVRRDPTSKRGHPNLFEKLARAMQIAGVPAPVIGKDGETPPS